MKNTGKYEDNLNLIGPILILNPLFTKKLIQMLGIEKPTIAFEKETMDAYKQRLEEFKK